MKDNVYLSEQDQKQLIYLLRKHVKILSHDIGPRNFRHYSALTQAAEYIQEVFREYQYVTTRHEYILNNKVYANIEAELMGVNSPQQLVLIGAHYDSANDSPGANDNASGVAVMLEIARLIAQTRPNCAIKFVAFTNEEPPFTHTKQMGSYRYAAHIKSLSYQINAMFSLETLGCFSEERARYGVPLLKYLIPYKQNFLAFIGNIASKNLVNRTSGVFKICCSVPVKTLTAWGFLPGIKASDQESFWKHGYKGIMITDTAWARDWQAYHTSHDTFEKLNYPVMAEIAIGLAHALPLEGEGVIAFPKST